MSAAESRRTGAQASGSVGHRLISLSGRQSSTSLIILVLLSPPLVGPVLLARANYFYFRLRSSKAHGLGTFATLQGGHFAAARKRSKYFLLYRTAGSPAGEGGGCKRRCDCADLTPCRHLLLPYGVLRAGSLGDEYPCTRWALP